MARYVRLPSGARQITNLYLPGDFCEPQWIVDPVSAEWIMALSAVQVTGIQLEQLVRDGVTEPSPSREILAEVICLVARQSALLVAVGRKSGLERVSSLLIELYNRSASVGARARPMAMPLTQGDLADIVGLTPIHVNRIMKELRSHQAVEVCRGTITILDPEKLRTVIGVGHLGPVRQFRRSNKSQFS